MARASRETWNGDHLPDLQGRVAIVTGANSGLGLEASKGLAARGAHVTLACRDANKARDAMVRIRGEVQSASLEFMHLDLACLMSIRNFSQQFQLRHTQLDILCNNAGVMALPMCRTRDGFEMQIGTNHLGHFALTGLLLDVIQSSGDARIVNTSSLAHRFGRMNFEDLNSRKHYSKWKAYGQSKLANLLFTYELQRRLDQAQIDAISVACHPGYASTNLQLAGPLMENAAIGKLVMRASNRIVAQSERMGAMPCLYAAASPDVEGGDYIGPDGFRELRGYPVKVRSSRRSHDEQAADRLWTLSEELTGVSYLAETD